MGSKRKKKRSSLLPDVDARRASYLDSKRGREAVNRGVRQAAAKHVWKEVTAYITKVSVTNDSLASPFAPRQGLGSIPEVPEAVTTPELAQSLPVFRSSNPAWDPTWIRSDFKGVSAYRGHDDYKSDFHVTARFHKAITKLTQRLENTCTVIYHVLGDHANTRVLWKGDYDARNTSRLEGEYMDTGITRWRGKPHMFGTYTTPVGRPDLLDNYIEDFFVALHWSCRSDIWFEGSDAQRMWAPVIVESWYEPRVKIGTWEVDCEDLTEIWSPVSRFRPDPNGSVIYEESPVIASERYRVKENRKDLSSPVARLHRLGLIPHQMAQVCAHEGLVSR